MSSLATLFILLAGVLFTVPVWGQSWNFASAQNKAEAMAKANKDATFALFKPTADGLVAAPSASASASMNKDFDNWATSMDLAFTSSTRVSSPALRETGSYSTVLPPPPWAGQIFIPV